MSERKATDFVSTGEVVRHALRNEALAGDNGLTVKQLHELTGRGEAQLRRTLQQANGWVAQDTEWRTSYSTNYPSMESGVHKVTVYRLSRRALLTLLKQTQEVSQ